jgi:hypothetical protein
MTTDDCVKYITGWFDFIGKQQTEQAALNAREYVHGLIGMADVAGLIDAHTAYDLRFKTDDTFAVQIKVLKEGV